MSKLRNSSSGFTRAGPPVDQQRLIAEQTAAFLASGHRIQQIPRGVSGQLNLGGPRMPETQSEQPSNNPT